MQFKNTIPRLFLLAIVTIIFPAIAYSTTIRDNTVTNSLAPSDDGFSGSVALGFSTNFLGYSNSALYVMNNGNIQFNAPPPPANFEPTALTALNGRQTIAPFMGDVDTRLGSVVTYGTATINNHNAFIANWPGVGYYTAGITGFDKLNDFQLVLIDRSETGSGNFDIEFNYASIQWDVDSGSAVSAGYSDGAGTSYLITGSNIAGSFLDSNTTTGLVYSSNIGVLGRFLFLARNGTMILSPVYFEAIASTPYQNAIAKQLDDWQAIIGGNFGSAITQINSLGTSQAKRSALEEVGVSFLSAFSDSGFELTGNALSQVESYLDNKRDSANNDSAKNINSYALSDCVDYFASISSDSGEFDRTDNQKGYHYKGLNFTNGLGFYLSDDFIFGAAFDYGSRDSKINDDIGELNSKSYTGSLYASKKFFGQGYFDLIVNYSSLRYDYSRQISIGSLNLSSDGNTRGSESGFKLLGGYDFGYDKFRWGPTIGLQCLDIAISGYTETSAGNLSAVVSRQKASSLVSSLGAKVTYKLNAKWCELLLNSHLSWEHEFKDNERDVSASFYGTVGTAYDTPIDGPERDYARLGLSLAGVVKNWELALDYNVMLFNQLTRGQRVTASCRIKF